MAGISAVAREAKHGERMVELRVRFWTDGIAEGDGQVSPKHAWGGGMVRMKPNKSHGISSARPVPFNSLMELPAAIEKVLIQHGIRIHPVGKMRKYVMLIDTEAA